MHIRSVQIRNYRAFQDQTVEFTEGLNLLVGPNNSGKSTVLGACGLAGPDSQTRIHYAPTPPPTGPAEIIVRAWFSGDELRRLASAEKVVGMPSGRDADPGILIALFDRWLTNSEGAEVAWTLRGSGVFEVVDPTFGVYPPMQPGKSGALVWVKQNPDYRWLVAATAGNPDRIFARALLAHLRLNLRILGAERKSEAKWQRPERDLQRNARNLVGVIEDIQAKSQTRDRFRELVCDVLPEVQDLTVQRDDNAEIRVWFHDPKTENEGLAIPLTRCGSGMEQVLALIAAPFSVPKGGIVLIDEPQAFLHPGALGRILDVIAASGAAQVIVATHSPQLVNRPDVRGLIELQLLPSGPTVTQHNRERLDDVHKVLTHLGTSPAEVCLTGPTLWLEGPSERAVFRELQLSMATRSDAGELRRICGVVPIGVAHTDRLVPKQRDDLVGEILALYEKIGASRALLPSVCGFLLDWDERSFATRKSTFDRRKGRIAFTKRMMLENYLVDAEAFRTVLVELQNDADRTLSIDTDIIESQCSKFETITGHGAETIEGIFLAASGNRIEYRKVQHAPLIARALLAAKPSALDELAELALACIDGVAAPPIDIHAVQS